MNIDELEYWADPQRQCLRETNPDHGGRGHYFLDPAGHNLELTAQPDI